MYAAMSTPLQPDTGSARGTGDPIGADPVSGCSGVLIAAYTVASVGPGDDQRLRPDRGDGVRRDEHAAAARHRVGADRRAYPVATP
ncbi:hypothetical protein MAHJHV57_54690 [Mycobacterium avium subsp. hominissuis]